MDLDKSYKIKKLNEEIVDKVKSYFPIFKDEYEIKVNRENMLNNLNKKKMAKVILHVTFTKKNKYISRFPDCFQFSFTHHLFEESFVKFYFQTSRLDEDFSIDEFVENGEDFEKRYSKNGFIEGFTTKFYKEKDKVFLGSHYFYTLEDFDSPELLLKDNFFHYCYRYLKESNKGHYKELDNDIDFLYLKTKDIFFNSNYYQGFERNLEYIYNNFFDGKKINQKNTIEYLELNYAK